jgi:nucleotide-binding universal stress UspA family protein
LQIAIAVDGSPVSGVVVRWCAQTLLRASDSIALLHSPAGLDEFATLSAAGQLVECEAVLSRFLHAPERAKEQLRTVRLAPEEAARDALVAAVEREGPFDLLVVGSRGMGSLKRAAAAVAGHGSVSTHALQHAPCPVLVVSRATLLAWVEAAAVPPPAAAAAAAPGTPVKAGAPPPKAEAAAAAAKPGEEKEKAQAEAGAARLTASTTGGTTPLI